MINKIFGIHYLQRGGLVNKQYSGTWGNRGQGNELQSALDIKFSTERKLERQIEKQQLVEFTYKLV